MSKTELEAELGRIVIEKAKLEFRFRQLNERANEIVKELEKCHTEVKNSADSCTQDIPK